MAKYQKVKRTKNIYSRRKGMPSWIKWVVILIVAVGIGFFIPGVVRQIKQNLAQRPDPSLSSFQTEDPTSSKLNSEENLTSSQISSEEISSNEELRTQGAVLPQNILLDAASWSNYLQNLKTQQVNTVILDLKDDVGMLYYNSSVPLAIEYSAVSPQHLDTAQLQQLIQEIENAGMTPVARISTLKDRVCSRTAAGTCYLYQGDPSTAWLDNSLNRGGKTWLNPYQENARKYLSDIAAEIAQAGFQQIVLKDFEYPSADLAQMGIANQTVSQANMLKQTYQEIQSAIAPHGAELILQCPATAFYGVNNIAYGGSPVVIEPNRVLLYLTSEMISENADLSVFTGLDLNAGMSQAAEAILNQLSEPECEMTLLIPSSQQQNFADISSESSEISYIFESLESE